MATQTNPIRTFTAGGVIPRGAAVKLNGSTANSVVVAAAATDDVIGWADGAAASGAQVAVVLRGRVVKAIASAAITVNAPVMVGANGKVATRTATNAQAGTALEAAANDGDIIEVLVGGFQGFTVGA